MNRGAAFVVGGTGGLGSAICRRLASDWDGIAIGYRSSSDKAQALINTLGDASGEALAVQCNLMDRHS
ncbi:SDR family NAD(P)-dependent oxidoreductase, partial [Sporosarcina koreensis]|uniref:SDR family NAD(P)-dependent oxidoreductase n=1 Tax=Sporosarcina koreensis TaxID=334735 RepID=UPI000B0CAD57